MTDDRLKALDVLTGTWSIEMVPPGGASLDVRGTATFAWVLGGAFLQEDSTVPLSGVPDGTCLYAPAAEGRGYTQHYFDSRGVARLYAMTLEDGLWTLTRDTADFSPLPFRQRFQGRFEDGGATIRAAWHRTDEHDAWLLDFELVYRRTG